MGMYRCAQCGDFNSCMINDARKRQLIGADIELVCTPCADKLESVLDDKVGFDTNKPREFWTEKIGISAYWVHTRRPASPLGLVYQAIEVPEGDAIGH